MMNIGIVLIIITVLISYRGFANAFFFDNYKFEVDKILIDKDYKRLITAGFLHVNWMHLIFNMLSLYFFAGILITQLGTFHFLLIYFAGLLGGNLLALLIHKHHGDYCAVGASGAVIGIIFASIGLFPQYGIRFIGLPFSIPSWLFGILYIAYTIYGIKSDKDTIAHEAHLGGALVGMLIAIVIRPSAAIENFVPIMAITIPTIVFIFLIITKPQLLFINTRFYKPQTTNYTEDDKYNTAKINKQKELNRLLDKISNKGIESLSKKEKGKLEEYSK